MRRDAHKDSDLGEKHMTRPSRLKALQYCIHDKYDVAPIGPEASRRARFYMRWLDHEILRCLWSNFAEIAPGVYRSNHPTRKRFHEYHARGITTVLNLRGESNGAVYHTEKMICDELGIALHNLSLHARSAPPADVLLALLDKFHSLPKPFLMHCKSGADRAGLASALYKLEIEESTVEAAQKMLSWRFIHNKSSRTGVLDLFLESYKERLAQGEISIRDWIAQEYDPKALQERFEASRKKR